MNSIISKVASLKVISGLLAVILISGCSSLPPTAHFSIERNGIDMVTTTSDLQSTFFKDERINERLCASRPSDVADTRSEGTSLSLSAVGLSEGVGAKDSQGAISLGGRNPEVLITREILYRACEFTLNHNTTVEQSIQVYKILLDAVVKISASQTSTGTSSIGQSEIMPTFNKIDKPIAPPNPVVVSPSNDNSGSGSNSGTDDDATSGSDSGYGSESESGDDSDS